MSKKLKTGSGQRKDPVTGLVSGRQLTPGQAADWVIELYSKGKLNEAEKMADNVIGLWPAHGDAHHILGLLKTLKGEFASAEHHLTKAIQYLPGNPSVFNSYGNLCLQQKRYDEAEKSYLQALNGKPDYSVVWGNLGGLYHQKNQVDKAKAAYEKALELKPQQAEIGNNLAVLLREEGSVIEAEKLLRDVLEWKPELAEAWNNLAQVHLNMKRYDQALACCRQALSLKTDFAAAMNNQGLALENLGRLDEAIAAFGQVPSDSVVFGDATNNKAQLLLRQGKPEAAIALHRQLWCQQPRHPISANNLAVLLSERREHEEALSIWNQLLEEAPTCADVWLGLSNHYQNLLDVSKAEQVVRRALEHEANKKQSRLWAALSNICRKQGKMDEAMSAADKAVSLSPQEEQGWSSLANCLADDGQFERASDAFTKALAIAPDSIELWTSRLFYSNHQSSLSATDIAQLHFEFGKRFEKISPSGHFSNAREVDRRIKVGFVSADLHGHPIGFFMQGVFAHLNQNEFEIFIYANQTAEDDVTKRIRSRCQHWVCIKGMPDEVVVRKIREDGIDVLFDLSGHTAGQRLMVFARKPAPVQISYLGYFATTGLHAMDYILGNRIILPPDEADLYTERLLWLPETYLAFSPAEYGDVMPLVASLPMLKKGAPTFGCFNNLTKVNDKVIEVWSKILQALPESSLFLKFRQLGNEDTRRTVAERFRRHGIQAERLILEGASPYQEYLAKYGEVDLALDPFPYQGGTTSVQGLWMGVPMVSMAGDRYVSRMGENILRQTGLTEFLAHDEEDYIQRAIEAVSRHTHLATLRETMRERMLNSSMSDTARFTGYFETAIRLAWADWCAGQTTDRSPLEVPLSPRPRPAMLPKPQDSGSAAYPLKPVKPIILNGQALSLAEANAVVAQCWSAGQVANAETMCRAILQVVPQDVNAIHSLGALLLARNALSEAQECFERVLAVEPNNAHACCNMGVLNKRRGALRQAEACYRRAIQIDSHYFEALSNLSSLLNDLRRPKEAEDFARQAIAVDAQQASAWNNLGNALQSLHDKQGAMQAYRECLARDESYAEVWSNLAVLQMDQADYQTAEQSIRHALVLREDFAEAWNNLSGLLKEQGRLEEAFEASKKAVSLLRGDQQIGAWTNLLFTSNYRPDLSRDDVFALHQEFGRVFESGLKPHWPVHKNLPDPGKRLLVGFVTPDFREHPVGYFMEGVLEHLRNEHVVLHAYATHLIGDARTARIAKSFHVWREVPSLQDAELALLIEQDGIDVLIDLTGHTRESRLLTFARKPAPVQISYLGYFNTTGLQAMDYILGNRYVLPEQEWRFYVEKPLWLAGCHLCFTPPGVNVPVAPLPATTQGWVTYGCFNHMTKITDAVLACWASILNAQPSARLLLKNKHVADAAIAQRTRQRFADQGGDVSRLILEGPSPYAEYLASYSRIDIALDPFPYGGGTTSMEALWMGVPVLTLCGDRYASHMTESLLMGAGLSAWVTDDLVDYLKTALTLSSDIQSLARLRAKLRRQVEQSGLVDANTFARDFAACLRQAWQAWCVSHVEPQTATQGSAA